LYKRQGTSVNSENFKKRVVIDPMSLCRGSSIAKVEANKENGYIALTTRFFFYGWRLTLAND